MGTGPKIVAATPQDAAAVAAIYAHHVRTGVATFETIAPDAAEMARRIGKQLDRGSPWLIARDGTGEALGYAYAGRFHPRSAYRFTCEDSIYIRHDRLGQGIGTALLAALIQAAAAAGFRQMIAQIVGGEEGSVALHLRQGFAEAGRLHAVGRKHGRWLDVIVMQRAVGGGGASAPDEEP